MKTSEGKKTAKGYWDDMWQSSEAANSIDPRQSGIKNYTARMFHNYFQRVFSTLNSDQSRLLEIGCANSAWLPYFSKEFGFEVTGLDYSEVGCTSTRKNLVRNNINGEVVCADLFSPPAHMLGRYDVVVSFGVVEHFDDTAKCLAALSKLLKDGGLLITNIPNMSGAIGFVQKHINRPVYDIHNPIDSNRFHQAHEDAGLKIIECNYFMSTSFGVCNLNGIPEGTIKWLLKKLVLAFLTRCSMLVWLIEEKSTAFPARRLFSPYINCVVMKQ